LIYALNYYLLT